jgi:hypothetical protein
LRTGHINTSGGEVGILPTVLQVQKCVIYPLYTKLRKISKRAKKWKEWNEYGMKSCENK